MAAPRMTMMCLFTFLALIFIFSNTPAPAEANIIKDAMETIEDVTCPLKHQDEANVCTFVFWPLYYLQAAIENDRQKVNCCDRLLTQNCMNLVTETYCGEVARFAATIATSLDKLAAKDKCGRYESLDQCTHPVLAFLLITCYVACVFSIIAGVISCIRKMCR